MWFFFEWKWICAWFLLSFVYCRWRFSYQEGRVGIPLTGLTPPHLCYSPKTGPGFPTLDVVIFVYVFSEFIWNERWSFCWYWWNCWSSLFKLSLFCWYWWNCWPLLFKRSFVDIAGIVDHYCLNFLLFCWYWWNYWPSLLKLSFVLLILVELLTITVLNFLLLCWYWWNCWPSLF